MNSVTTTYPPYYNKEEYLPVAKMKLSPAKVEKLKAMADAGNIQAALLYGELLMTGAWDIKRMETDLTRGVFVLPSKDVSKDEYLILPRNQMKAVEYLKIAASYPDEDICRQVSLARAHLNYCRRKGNIGFYGHSKLGPLLNVYGYKHIDAAATAEDMRTNPFFPIPYKRPTVENPKTKVFAPIAKELNAFLIKLVVVNHLLIISATAIFLDYNAAFLETQLLVLTLFTLPAFLVGLIVKQFGTTQPLCACPEIKKAYDVATEELPLELKHQDDPFENSSFLIRNIMNFFLGLYGLYILVAIVLSLLYSQKIIRKGSFLFLYTKYDYNFFLLISVAPFVLAVFGLKDIELCFGDKICHQEYLRQSKLNENYEMVEIDFKD